MNGQLMGDWLHDLDQQGKSVHTRKGYARGVRHFARWYEQSGAQAFDPTGVVTRDVRDWMAFQQVVEGAKPATVNQRLAAVAGFYRWATAKRHVQRNPADGVRSLDKEQHKPKALDQRDLRRMRREVHRGGNLRDVALFEVLVGVGLRVSEALALTVEDVTLRPRSGQVTVRAGKGQRYREVPLTREVRQALREYLEANPGIEGALWVGQRGPLRDSSAVNRILAKYARRAGVDEVTPHTLRHSFATGYLNAHPDDIRHLAAILGHKDIKTTMVYTEPDLEELGRRMEKAEVKWGYNG